MTPDNVNPLHNEETQELVEAIYSAALAPIEYENTIALLDGLLFGASDLLLEADQTPDTLIGSNGQSGAAPYLATHIAAARKVQERIGSSRTVADSLQVIIDAVSNPSLIFAAENTILKANAAALARIGAFPDSLASFIADLPALEKIRAFLDTESTEDTSEADMIATTGKGGANESGSVSFIVKRLGSEWSNGVPGSLFLLSMIDLGFNKQAIQLFRAAHKLTKAEADVAVLLASGLRLSDIVEQRKVSLDTVRTQIKAIKNKTEAADIPALVRLIYAYSFNVSLPALGAAKTSSAIDKNNPIKRMAFVTLPDGRRLDYLEQGDANGQPVLMFHNVPYGVELPAAAIKQAFLENLRFIAPLRAGYAKSALLPDCHGDELISQNADDHVALLDLLKIKQVVALAHAAGSHTALRFASRHPSRVSALIATGRTPIWRDQWMQTMPQQQRLVLRLTKYMPKMLPLVLWSMVTSLDTPYGSKFIRIGCKESVSDTKAAENQETVDLIAKGAVSAARESLEGFASECAISMFDLTEEARAAKHKFHILHGNDDMIVPLLQSQTFVEEVPGTTLEIVENAGQLLFYSHWQQVMDAVLRAKRG